MLAVPLHKGCDKGHIIIGKGTGSVGLKSGNSMAMA